MLERTDELALIDESLRAAQAGLGAAMLFDGAAGIGKTDLLTAAIARAREGRMLVLSARGDELERSFPYAVVRELFEPTVMQARDAVRGRLLAGAAVHAETIVDPRVEPGWAPLDPAAVLHGLYWLTVNLAADRPLVLVVDDLHWSDQASMSWFAYLARRIEGLSVALILAARPNEPGADEALLQSLRASEGMRLVVPEPLSRAAVGCLARAALGEQVEQGFSDVCHEATGGNPFYAVELLRVLCQDRVPGTAASLRVIDGLTPRTVVDATLARLGRMPAQSRSVAEAVALLEPRAELRWIAELTGLDLDVAAEHADALLELGMLRSVAPCQFEHPILRAAVESEITPARRGRLHLKIARAFTAAGLPAQSIAAHLMQTPPSGESWVVSTLRQAAEQVSARGAPGGAAVYLERALAERPAMEARRELLLALGKAESHARQPHAAEHLREALALAEDPDQAAVAGLALGHALFSAGAIDDAYETVNEVVQRTDVHDSRAALELQALLLTFAGPAGRVPQTTKRAERLEARTPPASPAAGAVQASLALRELVAGNARSRVRARAEGALRGFAHDDSGGTSAIGREAPGMALLWIDELDRADQLLSAAIESASQRGNRGSFEGFCAIRGYAARQRGDLASAAADIEPILAAAAQGATPSAATLLALITQVLLLVDHGRPDAAEMLARFAPIPPAFERLPFVAMLRHAEAVAQLAQHKSVEAAATLTSVGEVCETTGIRSPVMVPWRSHLALALACTARHEEGLEHARFELRLAERCDVDRARGVALRAIGLLERADDGLQRLQDAVQALERSPARLELGWASYELGGALRRQARRRDARAPLDRALDVALACGSELLTERCQEQLQALGARPRSIMLTGAESLTPSELRVCRLAARGLKNAEIAQALFVTLKTVETHLRSSYRKLDIASRVDLPRALDATPG